MPFRSGFPIVYAGDLPASLAFYRDLLGFAEIYRQPEEGEPAFVSLEQGGTKLGLVVHGAPEAHFGVTPGGGIAFELWLYCDDVDAEIERLRAAGVAVLREPADMPWGERLAYVADPDGNPVSIAAKLS
ncbi:MAG TPA: VOC family protein [Gaiellaceae bacterium]|nr:VOC family protein [Gaiellaceae bacterium]